MAKRDEKHQLWGGRMTEPPDAANVAYCAGRDVAPRPMADAVLVPFDVWQNRAHVLMLAKQGIIPARAAGRLVRALAAFGREVGEGRLTLDPRKEDVHTNIEHYVAGRVGAHLSGLIHTARSRNDQSATVMRMFVRSRLLAFGASLDALVRALLDCALTHADTPMAGMTHYQPASVTTVGHWLASHAQALLRDLGRILETARRINLSPLGAAASFGTSWPIDRTFTARLLAFDGVQENTLDCVTNRWEAEADAAAAVSFVMTHLSILAQDLIILSLPQIGVVRIADRFVTGSSIMPQKRNPDFAEVTRAKAAAVHGLMATLFATARGLVSGYNRDTQWTKYAVMDIFAEAESAPRVFEGVVASLAVDRDRAAALAADDFVDAVDVADAVARDAGIPFRTAYDLVSQAVRLSEGRGKIDLEIVKRLAAEKGASRLTLRLGSPEQIAAAKTHTGAPAPQAVRASIRGMRRRLATLSAELTSREDAIKRALAETDERCRALKP
ncbi:MAG: argininosuccinate lyase [Candidatus Sumerlaeaceae bacterium]|nr:argininosuccinate lyase [Candidatus Sumerlaeaceae bacterium]